MISDQPYVKEGTRHAPPPSSFLLQVIPLYGRGCEESDPRKKAVEIPSVPEEAIPRRPAGLRPVAMQVAAPSEGQGSEACGQFHSAFRIPAVGCQSENMSKLHDHDLFHQGWTAMHAGSIYPCVCIS